TTSRVSSRSCTHASRPTRSRPGNGRTPTDGSRTTARSIRCAVTRTGCAWATQTDMPKAKRAFYEYHASLVEPWDGPAALAFTDGDVIGATLDRNGLRPAKYVVTKSGLVVMASELGVLSIDPADVVEKGRLEAGKMFLVDTKKKRIVSDEEVKKEIAARKPYARWVAQAKIDLASLPD